jgi:glycosyltransferase involved in cell wall biosynthesis
MKLNVFSFMNPLVHGGGGEMISRALIEEGRRRGHDIRVSSVRPFLDVQHEDPDLNIFIDIHNFGHTWRSLGAWRGFDEQVLRRAAARAPFVHLTNAYVDFCNLPYLPCSGEQGVMGCPIKPQINWARKRILLRDVSTACGASKESMRWLYAEAALNVYLSPLHQRVTESLLALQTPPPAYILPPMIDVTRFFNQGLERDIDYLFVGVISEAKGLNAMRERFRGANIVLVGRCATDARVDFGTHIAHIPYDEVPRYMNRAKNFVFLPRWPEPQGRVVAEAALCGCNIVGNENVGALSFGADLSEPANYTDIEANFWQRVEKIRK